MEVKWIKITTDMFDHRKIRYLRRQEQGNEKVMIWVMLLTLAGRCNDEGRIRFTESIPYTAELLGDELGFDKELVRETLETLEMLDMVDLSDGEITVLGWNDHQNSEGLDRIRKQTKERVAKYREKNKKQDNDGNATGNATVTQCNAIDKEEEREEEKEILKNKKNMRQGSLPQDTDSGNALSLPPKKAYGSYENVLLSDDSFAALQRDFPGDLTERIENLSSFLQVTGKEYRDHDAAIRHYAAVEAKKEAEQAERDEKRKKNPPRNRGPKPPRPGTEPRHFRGEQEDDDFDLIVL